MKHLFSSAFSVVSVAGALVLSMEGCSSSNGGPPDTAHYAAYMASAFCGSLQACCQQAGFQYDDGSCEAQMTSFFQSDPTRGVDSVKHGKVIYNASAAATCAQAYKDREGRCSVSDSGVTITEAGLVDPIETACAGVLQGTVPLGQACTESVECATGAAGTEPTCAADTQNTPGGGLTRVCYQTNRHALPGQPCTLSGYAQAECDSSVGFCQDANGQIANNGTCAAYAAIGDACTLGLGGVGGTQAGALCDPRSGTCDLNTRKCVALPSAGQPCAAVRLNGSGCAAGNYCDTTGAGNGTCAAQRGDGAACTQSSECANGICANVTGNGNGQLQGECGASGLNDISPRTCGFGPDGTGPEDGGILPPAKAP